MASTAISDGASLTGVVPPDEPRLDEPRLDEPRLDEPGTRVIDATLRCIARWGVAKTTLDDVAREARCSRATVYRLFPGGKDVLVEAVIATELQRFLRGLDQRLRAVADGDAAVADGARLEDLLVAGMTYTARALRHHDALQYLLTHEPEQVLPHVCFDRYDAVLAAAAAFLAPHLRPHLDQVEADRAGEWVTRLVLSYVMCPSPLLDVTDDDDVRRFVRTFVVPGLARTALSPSLSPSTPVSQ